MRTNEWSFYGLTPLQEDILRYVEDLGGMENYRIAKPIPPQLWDLLDRTLISCADIKTLPEGLVRAEPIHFSRFDNLPSDFRFIISSPFDISTKHVDIWLRHRDINLDLKPVIDLAYREVNAAVDARLRELSLDSCARVLVMSPIVLYVHSDDRRLRFVILAGVGSK